MSACLGSGEHPPEAPEQPAEQTVDFEPVYTANMGVDTGISTVGYRSKKYSPGEWHDGNYRKFYQSFANRDKAERVRYESNQVIKETECTTNQTQAEVTKKLGERLHDINFWKFELRREIQDLIDEIDLLVAQKKRLENALRATEIPLHIATDNLNCRQRRQALDLVQDEVELQLLKEVDIINNVKDLLKRTLDQTDKQIKFNKDAKQELEMDWSDKYEAEIIDKTCGSLRNEDTNKQFYAGSAKFEEVQSTPESWAQFSHDNIVRGEHERMASSQLRTLIDNVLQDTSRDMREQCDTVDVAFAKRVDELQDSLAKLEDHLKKVCCNITSMEKNIANLKEAIRNKDNPMKVAQTRLHNRTFRPGVDLCRDPVQYKLVGEVSEISQSIDALTQKLNESENSLKDLMDSRMSIEDEISTKKNSIFIDKEKCMTHRTRYPPTLRLQGYNQ